METKSKSGQLNREWPSAGLEKLSKCPVCDGSSRHILHEALQDHIFFCAPGTWTMWRCDECQSGYLDPRPTIDHISIAYATYYTHESHHPKHNADHTSGKIRRSFRLHDRLRSAYLNTKYGHNLKPDFFWLNRLAFISTKPFTRQWDYFIRNLPSPQVGDQLLDIGCGNGRFIGIARKLGYDAIGIEIDPVVIQNARATGEKVIQARLPDTTLESARFDHITLHHVLEHLHDPNAGLRECFRLLKKNGRLWIQIPNIDSIGHDIYGPYWRGLEPPRHLALPSLQALKKILNNAGFIRTQLVTSADAVDSYFSKSELILKASTTEQIQRASLAVRKCALKDERRDPARHEHLTLLAYRS
ncbi:hypothetical protein CKO25_03185 [Thiocapsa imhoffii]|uniref:Class I SAM-dependent methyltransferase n=1 Tax=Thiocapsa imhoffii TaxID=382777 RepID=A0A9X0WFC9_9GAMM|nr:class I SAM-dependent methyltransferase [Thiocapsa imhoffii]MBK1643679.1 hypothetical protein [Thiocapsa imhoffii]